MRLRALAWLLRALALVPLALLAYGCSVGSSGSEGEEEDYIVVFRREK